MLSYRQPPVQSNRIVSRVKNPIDGGRSAEVAGDADPDSDVDVGSGGQ